MGASSSSAILARLLEGRESELSKMIRSTISLACSAAATIAVAMLFPASLRSNESQVSVDTWTTAATPLAPELHLLLRNSGQEPLDFLLEIGRAGKPGGGIECDVKGHRVVPLPPPASTPEESLRRHSLAAIKGSLGVIPARGWAHRSYLIGYEVGAPPCHVHYTLTLRGSETPIFGAVDIPATTRQPRSTLLGGALSFDSTVEINRFWPKSAAILRVLVNSRRDEAVELRTSEIRFRCEEGDPIEQEQDFSTLPGEDTGPFSIEPGGNGVYVFGIKVPTDTSLDRCVASVTFADHESHSTTSREFRLSPAGYFDHGGHGFRGEGSGRRQRK